MAYAFDEFRNLLPLTGASISERDPRIRYACALVSELAYYHVPQFEIDDKKRAQLIPCDAHASIVASGSSSDVGAALRTADFVDYFVVVDRNVIAVGLALNKLLFIGFRGTSFLFDWRINLATSLTEATSSYFHDRRPYWRVVQAGRVHKGFAEEAIRISAKIVDVFRDKGYGDIEHLFLCGHSLGGAVAALSERFLRFASASICMFGAPRYCDTAFYFNHPIGPPTQIQRVGDIVPYVPPRWFGYADHPYQFDTKGEAITARSYAGVAPYLLWEACLFAGKRFAPHSMESYRRELGRTAKAISADAPLVPFEKLKASHIS